MIRLSSIVWLLICGLMVGGLFYVKYDVQGLEKDLSALRIKNLETRDGIRILKAEWSLLNQATRLRRLGAAEKLDLRPITQRQLINIEKLPVSFILPVSISERSARYKTKATSRRIAAQRRVRTSRANGRRKRQQR